MKQSEHQAGEKHSYAFAILCKAVNEKLPEDQLFGNRGAEHHDKQIYPEIGAGSDFKHGIGYRASLQDTDQLCQDKTDIIAHIHGTIAHEKSDQPLTEGHVLFGKSHSRNSLDQKCHDRHGDHIHRNHNDQKRVTRAGKQIRIDRVCDRACAELNSIDERGPDQKHQTDAGKLSSGIRTDSIGCAGHVIRRHFFVHIILQFRRRCVPKKPGARTSVPSAVVAAL